ncbi:MAG: GNAT family N-acetyltransferase [Cyanobium sp.]
MTPESISPLRPLKPSDREACLALDGLALGGLWTPGQWQTELEDDRRPGLGIWRGEELLAMASGWLVVDELHITLVAVAPTERRRGLGRLVLQGLLATAREGGAERATLEVASGNSAARALYGCCGFRDAGIRHGYYRNGDDALIQWLKLEGCGTGCPKCG